MILNQNIVHNVYGGGGSRCQLMSLLHNAADLRDQTERHRLEYVINRSDFQLILRSGSYPVAVLVPDPVTSEEGAMVDGGGNSFNTMKGGHKTTVDGIPARYPDINGVLHQENVSTTSPSGMSEKPSDVRPALSTVYGRSSGIVTAMALEPIQDMAKGGHIAADLKRLWFNSVGLMGTVETADDSVMEIDSFEIRSQMYVYDSEFYAKALINLDDLGVKIPVKKTGYETVFSGTVGTNKSCDIVVDNVTVTTGDVILMPNLCINIANDNMKVRLSK